MYGSGAPTGKKTTRAAAALPTIPGRAVCCAAVAGAATPGTAVFPIAATTVPTTAATTVFVWFFSHESVGWPIWFMPVSKKKEDCSKGGRDDRLSMQSD